MPDQNDDPTQGQKSGDLNPELPTERFKHVKDALDVDAAEAAKRQKKGD